MSALPATSSLAECEAVIERGLHTFVEVGEALMRIRDEHFYRTTHGTFEDYCRERWGFSRQTGYDLMQTADVARTVQEVGQSSVSREQARELAPLRDEPELLREAWTEAVERFGDKPTAAQVQEVVAPKRPEPPKRDLVGEAIERIPQPDLSFTAVIDAAEELQKVPAPEDMWLPPDDGNRHAFDEAIRWLARWTPQMLAAWERRATSSQQEAA